ncbi:hypothetical protein Tco_0781554 [Tanacetum coccineum]
MVPPNNLGPDLNGKSVNETQYRGMIGSLMYLTASRPDIQFSTCLCARYQANPKESHLIVVKRIFRYLKGTPSLGLWYPKCSGFDLKGYSDSDYAGCNMDRKSTSAEYVAAAGCCCNYYGLKSQLMTMTSYMRRAQVDQGSQIKMIQVKEMMQDNDLKNSKSKDKGSRSRSQSMNEQSHYKQDKTKTRQSINVKSHIFNVRGDNDKSKQTPTRMSSVVRRSLKKETSTLGEIVSLNYIKSNKNVIGLRKLN